MPGAWGGTPPGTGVTDSCELPWDVGNGTQTLWQSSHFCWLIDWLIHSFIHSFILFLSFSLLPSSPPSLPPSLPSSFPLSPFSVFSLFFWAKVSYYLSLFQTTCVAKDDLERLILLFPPSQCCDCRNVPPCLVYVMLEMKSRVCAC